jgi:hypothetical protein
MTDQYVERNVLDTNGIVQVFRDYWWWCIEGDPKRALFFCMLRGIGSPQCNLKREIAEAIGERLGHNKCAKLVQIPLALVPWEG